MYSQNILKFYGSKLDIKLDSSELYDYEIGQTDLDYDFEVLDLTTPIIYSTLIIDSDCLITPLDTIKPWANQINTGITIDNCDFTIKRRTEKGWTLNFLFNRESNPWISGSTFYYWGISGETDPLNYLDNNLSFSFTEDGRIKWEAVHYSGNCGISGYTGSTYISSGQTGVLCTGGTSEDFFITITFDRYNYYTDCDVLNEGGSNDLITGWTVNNVLGVLTGATEDITIIEELNRSWFDERNRRLGILKIYLNGRPIYKLNDWEEVIPSVRDSLNPIIQKWGGGTIESGGLHEGTTQFNLKRIQYIEESLNFVRVMFHYLISIRPNYNLMECDGTGVDDPALFINAILTEDSDFITTEDGYILIY
jgi:hypothetical protein